MGHFLPPVIYTTRGLALYRIYLGFSHHFECLVWIRLVGKLKKYSYSKWSSTFDIFFIVGFFTFDLKNAFARRHKLWHFHRYERLLHAENLPFHKHLTTKQIKKYVQLINYGSICRVNLESHMFVDPLKSEQFGGFVQHTLLLNPKATGS